MSARTRFDDYTRECLAIEVDTSLPGLRVQQVRHTSELRPVVEHWFVSMRHAKRLIEQWRIEYNTSGLIVHSVT
ncbi:hypothetical protein BTHE68_39240 [Burkholderia sp. THE68]|nr:hypothetical protein BTHE68_39240 [Burkholderia sp. THE68]